MIHISAGEDDTFCAWKEVCVSLYEEDTWSGELRVAVNWQRSDTSLIYPPPHLVTIWEDVSPVPPSFFSLSLEHSSSSRGASEDHGSRAKRKGSGHCNSNLNCFPSRRQTGKRAGASLHFLFFSFISHCFFLTHQERGTQKRFCPQELVLFRRSRTYVPPLSKCCKALSNSARPSCWHRQSDRGPPEQISLVQE